MKGPVFLYIRLLICIFVASAFLYLYIDKQNELTQLRLMIPILTKEWQAIDEENTRLRYEIERFESPIHLMELSRKPEYGYLKYPYLTDIVSLSTEGEPHAE
jgi:hypothetical protein